MIITETEMYWLTRLDYFSDATRIIGTIGCILFVIGCILSFVMWAEEKDSTGIKVTVPALIVSLLITIGGLFIPNTKEMCAIKAIPMIVNNKQVQEIPDKVVNLANEWLEELKPNKNVEEDN